MLNQRLADMKKTLQYELKSSRNVKSAPEANVTGRNTIDAVEPNELVNNNTEMASTVVMDDVNFKYLKHVILKFLTSREVSLILHC